MRREKKFTINEMRKNKSANKKMTWITSYSYPMAYCAEQAGIDMILVGDSGGMTELGYNSTSPVNMDEMITFCKAVRRGAPNTFIVGDMPQGSYEVSNEDAIKNALRFIKEAECDAVKLEGGERIYERIEAIKTSGILVCGHLGLTPQTTSSFGGYNIQGKNIASLKKLSQDINFIGKKVDFLLIEAIPPIAMDYINKTNYNTKTLPIFGIGAGPSVDGQLLIIHDILGFYPDFKPRFAKNYLKQTLGHSDSKDMLSLVIESIEDFISEVCHQEFPSKEYCYNVSDEYIEDIKNEMWKLEKQDEIANYR